MDIWFIVENEMFNELVSFSFEEIRKLVNCAEYYVPESKGMKFVEKGKIIKEEYTNELAKIEVYEKEVYNKKVDSHIKVRYEEDPTYLVGNLESKIRDQLIDLIEEYFDKETFLKNKDEIIKEEVKEVEEDPYLLSVFVGTLRRQFYGFLSIIGYQQRHHNYFIRRSDIGKICRAYSAEVNYINKGLGKDQQEYHNIFGSWGRLGPNYIDVDKISLISFVLKHLNTNTNEMIEITKIMMKGFQYGSGDGAWDWILEESNKYIMQCAQKGLMKELK